MIYYGFSEAMTSNGKENNMSKQKPAYQVYGTTEHAEWCAKMREARARAKTAKATAQGASCREHPVPYPGCSDCEAAAAMLAHQMLTQR